MCGVSAFVVAIWGFALDVCTTGQQDKRTQAQKRRPFLSPMQTLIPLLSAAGNDPAACPTTDEIIAALIRDLRKVRQGRVRAFRRIDCDHFSVLDIGAGDARVLKAIRAATYHGYGYDAERPLANKLYAIEKDPVLCERMPADIFVLGTDFHEQELISKTATVTFCNPPVSEFEEWAVKIIRESASAVVYLVLPERWADSGRIEGASRVRRAKFQVIGDFAFHDATDPKRRSVAVLLRIDLTQAEGAFECFFNEQFAELRAKFRAEDDAADDEERHDARANEKAEAKCRQLAVGPNYPERLVALYNEEVDNMQRNYQLISQLDVPLLREFQIHPGSIMKGLKARRAALKNTYWQELLANLSTITNRLTSTKRESLLRTISEHGYVDFTVGNVHAVLLWMLKHANTFIDEQLVETVERMLKRANVFRYKSNTRVFTEDNWRYAEERPTHIALEYRLVLESSGGLNYAHRGTELSQYTATYLRDFLTIANNLGFRCNLADPRLTPDGRRGWSSSSETFFLARKFEVGDSVAWKGSARAAVQDKRTLPDGSAEYLIRNKWVHENDVPAEPLLEVRAFFNGNLHLRLNQRFALALNVEFGRLKGWLRSGEEAADELGNTDATVFFDTQLRLLPGQLPMLAPPARPDIGGASDTSVAEPHAEYALAGDNHRT